MEGGGVDSQSGCLILGLTREGGGNYQCFKSSLSLCLHLAIISLLLLSMVAGSAREMCVFSIDRGGRFLSSYRRREQG